jgi:hypothetical protein
MRQTGFHKAQKPIKGLHWLMFADPPHEIDGGRYIVKVHKGEILSPQPNPDEKLKDEQRLKTENVHLKGYKNLFCYNYLTRVEKGARPDHVDEAMDKLEQRYKEFKLQVGRTEALKKIVENFKERIYANWSYPDKSKKEGFVELEVRLKYLSTCSRHIIKLFDKCLLFVLKYFFRTSIKLFDKCFLFTIDCSWSAR